MNLAELTTFLTVIETKSLVRAAQRLNVTQSTVTARISSLEEKLGQKLLHRSKSGTELTSAGFKFVRYAEVTTQLWRQALYEVGLPPGVTSVCNVGCYFDLWEGIGERFLDHLRRRRPEVAVAFWPGDQRNIDRWLETGLVDIAFCCSPQAREPFAVRQIAEDKLFHVTFAKPAKAPATPGPAPTYVYIDHGEQIRRDHAIAFARESPPAVTLASSRWAIDHLSRWGGAGYLSRRHLALLKSGPKPRIAGDKPVLRQVIYLVENREATRQWSWFEEAVGALQKSLRREGYEDDR